LPWLMGIATNVLRERARWSIRDGARAVRQSSYTQEQWANILGRLSAAPREIGEPHPLWGLVAQLSKQQQDALRLRYVDDLPYPEIAQKLGCSEEAARSRICRALQALRRLLGSRDQPCN